MRRVARVLSVAALLAAVAASAGAASLAIDREPRQGGTVVGRTEPGCTLFFDGSRVRVAPDGHFILGFGRDNAAWAVLRVMCPDGTQRRQFLPVAERSYGEQRIDGPPPAMVSPDEAVLERIRAEAARVAAARATDSDLEGWREAPVWPVTGTVTGRYGVRRVLDGEPRQPHFGVDIAAPAGTPVRAAASGRVTLAETLTLSGGTVIVDHGFGLSSSYLHLETIAVAPGDRVTQGGEVGTVGATGRAAGPHLDWRLNWYRARLDPALAAGPMPETPRAASDDGATATAPAVRGSTPPESR